jgi:hypothetical protein
MVDNDPLFGFEKYLLLSTKLKKRLFSRLALAPFGIRLLDSSVVSSSLIDEELFGVEKLYARENLKI